MDTKRLVGVVAVGGVLLLGGTSWAAERQEAAVQKEQAVGQKFSFQPNRPQPPPPVQQAPAPFVPIVDGRLVAYHRHYPLTFSQQVLSNYGYLPPFGAYIYSPRLGYNPQLFQPEDYPVRYPTRVLIVVEPPDEPTSTYYYYDSFPYYYGQPGYYPGGQSVTVVSPTVPPQPEQQPAPGQGAEPQQGAVPEVQLPAGMEKASFVSVLAPMLGGGERVSMDFAVGELKLRRGDYEGATESLRRAVGAAPDEATPKLALGLARTGAGDYEGAAQVLKRGLRGMADWRGLKLVPDRVFGSSAAYGHVLVGLQAADQADQNAAFVLGFLCLASGRYAEAADALGRSGVEDPLVLGLLQEARSQERAAMAPEAGGAAPAE